MNLISLIIPVYNRPDEVEELLATLEKQECRDFETVIVEDGSERDCRAVVERYAGRLDVSYYYQPNGGPASARNHGAAKARGDFFVLMDSDCLVPRGYFALVTRRVRGENIKFYGGADSAAPDFSPLQKAVSYSMTSLFTTGGIRGNKKSAGTFMPRSFNMGIDRELFESVGGFSDMRIGEDTDFSLRVTEAGTPGVFLEGAAVCHKRRTSMRLFFKQVFIFGVARINLNKRHPGSEKLIYALPMFFTIGSVALLSLGLSVSLWFLTPLLAVMLVWFTDSAISSRSVHVGWLSIWTSFVQLYGYGLGYLYGFIMRDIEKRPEEATYKVTSFFSRKTR